MNIMIMIVPLLNYCWIYKIVKRRNNEQSSELLTNELTSTLIYYCWQKHFLAIKFDYFTVIPFGRRPKDFYYGKHYHYLYRGPAMRLPTMNANTSDWRGKIKIHRAEILSFHSFCDDCYQIADFIAVQKTVDMGSYVLCRGLGRRTFIWWWTMNSEGNNREQ